MAVVHERQSYPTCGEDGAARGASPDIAAEPARELEAIYSLSAALSSSHSFQETLQDALTQALEVFRFQGGVIRVLDPSTGELTAAAQAGLTPELSAQIEKPVQAGEPPEGLSIQKRDTVLLEDLQSSPFAGSEWGRAGYRTFVTAPLQCRGMLLGCISLAADLPQPFSQADSERLNCLGNLIAMALANRELYAAAQRRISYLSALHECTRDVGPAPELNRVLHLIGERMTQLLGLRRIAVFCWTPDSLEPVVAGGTGYDSEAIEALRHSLGDVRDRPSQMEREVHLSRGSACERLLSREFVRSQKIDSILVAPLLSHDRMIGLLVGDRGPGPLHLSADEMELAVIFAHQAAVWMASARLFEAERTARSEAEIAEARFRDLLEVAPDPILLVDQRGIIRLSNSQLTQMSGYAPEELAGQPVEILLPEEIRERHVALRDGYFAAPRTRPIGIGMPLAARRKDGSLVPVEISLSPSYTDEGVFGIAVVRDITERRQDEEERARLLASEQRKSDQLKLAVREAHHRIKNNLQAISDLLYLELDSSENSPGSEPLRESVERIQSIALVHDLLSQDEDVQIVDMRALAERLAPRVLHNAAVTPASIHVDLDVAPVPLSSKKATTLALLLNELISNSAKHAFAGDRPGSLRISLAAEDEGLALVVEDSGPGLPEGFDLAVDAHVGLQVVQTLAERDLCGRLTLSTGPGLTAKVWFPW